MDLDASQVRRKDCASPGSLQFDPTGMAMALDDGCRLHVFRSGGGLRVARLEKDGELKGYGEHPYVETAFEHAAEDYLAGQRPYKEVYGGRYDHYLTGSADASSDLDAQILRGRTLDAWREKDGTVVCEISGLTQTPTPKGLKKAVEEDGQPRKFKHRGFVYEISPFTFPGDGSKGVSIKIVGGRKPKNGSDGWMYQIVKTGRGSSLTEASRAALEAEEIEKGTTGH